MIECGLFTSQKMAWVFCCDKLEKAWISTLLVQSKDGEWYIKTEEEYDYLYLKYCPYCGEHIY